MIKIVLDSSVESLNFGSSKESETIHKVLIGKGITTVEELCRLTKSQFSKIFEMDVETIIFHLSKVGLRLGMNDNDFVSYIKERDKLLEICDTEYDNENLDDVEEFRMPDYDTDEVITFTNMCQMYEYFQNYVIKLNKEKEALQTSLTMMNESLDDANKALKTANETIHKLHIKSCNLEEMLEDDNKRIHDQRVFELAKEDFLRSKCFFKSFKTRVKESLLHAFLLVEAQKTFQSSLDKDKNKTNK